MGVRCTLGIAVMMAILPAAADELRTLDIRQVQVGGEIGRRIDMTVNDNLLVLDVDHDFLQPFQERTAHSGYVGLGKLIDAAVRLAAYTGDPAVLKRRKYLVDGILACQEPDGYIGMFVPESRLWSLWDIHEMSYLIYALTMNYQFFNETESLDAAKKAADYIIAGWSAAPDRKPGDGSITVYMAVTGLEPALLALHNATGEAKYLDFCLGQRKLAEWDGPIVEGRWGPIQGHAYAYMARCLAQVRLYRLQPRPHLLVPAHRALDYMLRQNGLVITGTCGQHECWHSTQEGAANLGETCATAYLIRLLDDMIRLEGDSNCGDLMERAIYNALFAAQSPDGRHIRYYSPQEGPRVYFDRDTYCCPCNYRRIIAELPGMIYYGGEHGITVNLYTHSSAKLNLNGVDVQVTQETDYPSNGNVILKFDPEKPSQFAVRLRVPIWCDGAKVQVNAEALPEIPRPGTFFTIERQWNTGDTVTLELPMSLQMIRGRVAQAGRVAVMYGPRVFCLSRDRNPALKDEDLHLITIDPGALEGPFPDAAVRPDGLACRVRAWRTTNWYPQAPTDWELTLTEFPDPAGEATYFHVPNPNDERTVIDPLLKGTTP